MGIENLPREPKPSTQEKYFDLNTATADDIEIELTRLGALVTFSEPHSKDDADELRERIEELKARLEQLRTN